MKQGGNSSSNGFTIVEVLIVLAASSLLFLFAVFYINGQQGKAEFVSAIQQTQSDIQQGINNVINGYYPNNNNIRCKVDMNGYPTVTKVNTNQAVPMGESQSCIFVGDVLQFNNNSPNYTVYPIYGNRFSSLNIPTHPYAVDLADSNARIMNIAGDYSSQPLDYGLIVKTVCYVDTSGNCDKVGAIALTSAFHSFATTSIKAGLDSVQLNALANVKLNGPPVSNMEFVSTTAGAILTGEVKICFNSTSSSQSGLITINATGSNVSNPLVTLSIMYSGCS